MAATPIVVEVTRSYSGQEGFRVKAGTRFAVEKGINGLRVIDQGRYMQLLRSGLVRPYKAGDSTPLARAPTPKYEGQVKSPQVMQPAKTQVRTAEKRRQEAKPSEPRPLENPGGGKTGADASASSSPAVQASTKSTSKSRGTRRSRPSQSTTPTKNADGQKPSTPATQVGGVSIKDARRSGA